MVWVRRVRVSMVQVAVVFGVLIATSTPASAGTLTDVAWSASRPDPSETAARYTYSAATATTGTISKVTATVPAGTSSSNSRYVRLPGVSGNTVTTPDSASFNPGAAGDLDIRLQLAMDDWTPTGAAHVLSKWGASGTWSWAIVMNATGNLLFYWSPDGTTANFVTSTVPVGVADGTTKWIAAVIDVNNGAGGSNIYFYTSNDNVSYTQLGATLSGGGVTSIYDSTANITIGELSGGGGFVYPANIYAFQLRNASGGTGTVTAKMDPADKTDFDSNWTSSSTTGEVWTVNRSGTNTADIRSTLSVATYSGLGAGSAFLSYYDGRIQYSVTSPTSIASGTPFAFGVDDITNTATNGNYTTTLTTYDNAGTPATIDSGTSNTQAIPDNALDLSVPIGRSITFVNNVDEIMMLVDPSTAAMSDKSNNDTQLVIATNSKTGYTLALKAANLTAGGGNDIAPVSVSGTTSCVVSGSFTANRWGYAVITASAGSSSGATLTRLGDLASSKYCGPATSNTDIVSQIRPTNGDTIGISHRVKIDYLSKAATYVSTVTYTATPNW